MHFIAIKDMEQGPYKKGDVFVAADDRAEDIELAGYARRATPEEVAAYEEKQRAAANTGEPTTASEAREKYGKMTVDELKGELESRDLPVSGSKAELVDRLVEDDAK